MAVAEIADSAGHVRRVAVDAVRDPRLRALVVAFGGLFFVTELYGAALPLLFDAAGLSAAVYGAVRAAANGVEIIASPFLGTLADERGRVRVAVVAAVGMAVALSGFFLARSLPLLAVLIALVAVGRLAVNNAITPAFSAAFDDGDAGVGWGLRDVVLYGGGALGLAVGSGLAVAGVRAVFPGLAAVLLLLAVLLWRHADDAEGKEEDESEQVDSDGDDESEQGDSDGDDELIDAKATDPSSETLLTRVRARLTALAAPFRGVSRPRVFARIAVVDLFVGVGTSAMAFLPLLAVDLGGSAAGFLALYGGAHLLAAPLSVVGGVLADRYSRKALYVGNFACEAVMLAAFGATVVTDGGQTAGTVVASLTPTALLFFLGIALFVAQTTFEPGVLAYFFDVFEESERGQVWGLKGTVSKTAGLIGPAVLGWLYTVDPQLPFLLGAVLTGVGAVVAVTLPSG
jgi:MFS family permease